VLLAEERERERERERTLERIPMLVSVS